MTSQSNKTMGWIVLLFCSIVEISLPSDKTIENLEQAVLITESSLDSLNQCRLGIINESDIVVQEIKTFQTKPRLDRKEHHDLEKALQKSQNLEKQIRENKSRFDILFPIYQKDLKRLIGLFQSSLEQLIGQIDNESDENSKTALLLRFQELDRKKQYWESKLTPIRLTRYEDVQMTQHPWDSAQDLRLKGNLLLDREESLRSNTASIDQQIRSYRREQTIRRKAESFSMEMALFNENEERLGRQTEIGADDKSTYNTESTWDPGLESGTPVYYGSSELYFGNEITSDTHDPALIKKVPRTVEEIAEAILRLEEYRFQLNRTADSLHLKAEWFLSKSKENQQL
jgi:hypothetical protein